MNAPLSRSCFANPLLEPWNTEHGLPPFARVEAAHFAPAFEVVMAASRRDRRHCQFKRRADVCQYRGGV